jgi:hypothetical protein
MPAISDTEYLYLQWINRFEILTARQLMRLLQYKATAYTTIVKIVVATGVQVVAAVIGAIWVV